VPWTRVLRSREARGRAACQPRCPACTRKPGCSPPTTSVSPSKSPWFDPERGYGLGARELPPPACKPTRTPRPASTRPPFLKRAAFRCSIVVGMWTGVGKRSVWVALVLFAVACGGESVSHSGSGGTTSTGGGGGTTGQGGSSGTSQGGGGGKPAAISACSQQLPQGTPCDEPGAQCGGPCVNQWQAAYRCENGKWEGDGANACGPNPPACKNAFAGDTLTPCCPTQGLDCSGKPDGYPGFSCTPGDGSFCSCACFQQGQLCGC
jgi:hypothetical protein